MFLGEGTQNVDMLVITGVVGSGTADSREIVACPQRGGIER